MYSGVCDILTLVIIINLMNNDPSRKLFGGVREYVPGGAERVTQSGVFDKLDEALTNSSKVAATLDDEFLTYLINMAVLHVRKKAAHLEDGIDKRPQRLDAGSESSH